MVGGGMGNGRAIGQGVAAVGAHVALIDINPDRVAEAVNEITAAGKALGLADTFCYATDYPHVEGNKESKMKMYEQIAPLGRDAVEKFFVKNADLLLPS